MTTTPDVIFCPFTVIVDTREGAPFSFQELTGDSAQGRKPLVVRTVRKGLSTGDYSIEGFEDRVAVERKSKLDLFGCMGKDRERFEKQVQRLNDLEHGFVVVEADWPSILLGSGESKLNPASVYGTVVSWQLKYPGVHWWMTPTREFAEKTTYRLLRQFWKWKESM